MKRADLIGIGKILRSQGNQGRLKIRFHERELPRLADARVYLRRSGEFEEFEVESLDLDRNSHILKLKGIDDLARADALAGLEIFVPEESFPALEGGRYYQFQVVGSRVVTVGGTAVGTVRDVIDAGGSSLLVVEGGGRDYYIPFTATICLRVDPERGEILVDPPDGLLELNEI